jgi:hypothetical protein
MNGLEFNPSPRSEAVERLASHMFESFERLDPGGGDEISLRWDDLHDSNRIFYIEVIHSLLSQRGAR